MGISTRRGWRTVGATTTAWTRCGAASSGWTGRWTSYAVNSNVTHAGKLQGKLMLTVGEVDTNVDPSSTLQVVDAVIKADKDFGSRWSRTGGTGWGRAGI